MNGFAECITAAGLEPPAHIEPGRWIRFPGLDKRRSNRAGWCYLFPDGQGGAFGDWSTGLSETWHAERDEFTAAERTAFLRKVAEARRRAERERAEAWAMAAERAREIWRAARPASPEHPYLLKKNISPHYARQTGPRLVLPIVGWDGQLSSLQFIGPDGDKVLLKEGRKQGRFIPVHGQRGAGRVVISEGFATAATVAESVAEVNPPALVLAALDAGNLKPVALEVRKHCPGAEIIVAADSDPIGIQKARAAAIACGGLVAVPEFPPGAEGNDWNDLGALMGVTQ